MWQKITESINVNKMELEWNYETIETGETVSRKLSDISEELRKTVTRIFKNAKDYQDLDLVSRYQQVFETVSFIFEDYRKPFEKKLKRRLGTDFTQEQQQMEIRILLERQCACPQQNKVH